MIKLQQFIRIDKNVSMIEAYREMNSENASFALLTHQDIIDVGFVSAKDVTKYLADKYIPDKEMSDKYGK
jgi:predicted transcriptional regulator